MDQAKRVETASGIVDPATPERGEETLGREDWIEAGITLLANQGVGAVKITQLAEDLGVTRGSFYWHFKDRSDLLTALVKVWDQRNTKALLAAVENPGDFADCILAVFECWLSAEPFAPRLDTAMRDWSHHAEEVRQAVKRADRKRIKAIAGVFERHGFPSPEANIRARVIYYTQVGYYTLEEGESITQRNKSLAAYFRAFTGRDLDEQAVKAFHKRVQKRQAEATRGSKGAQKP